MISAILFSKPGYCTAPGWWFDRTGFGSKLNNVGAMPHSEEQDSAVAEEPKPYCPKCGSVDIRPSHTRNMLDFLVQSFNLKPYRCRSCRKRFYMRAPYEDLMGEDEAEGSPPAPANGLDHEREAAAKRKDL
jgi:hypothetical protein